MIKYLRDKIKDLFGLKFRVAKIELAGDIVYVPQFRDFNFFRIVWKNCYTLDSDKTIININEVSIKYKSSFYSTLKEAEAHLKIIHNWDVRKEKIKSLLND